MNLVLLNRSLVLLKNRKYTDSEKGLLLIIKTENNDLLKYNLRRRLIMIPNPFQFNFPSGYLVCVNGRGGGIPNNLLNYMQYLFFLDVFGWLLKIKDQIQAHRFQSGYRVPTHLLNTSI